MGSKQALCSTAYFLGVMMQLSVVQSELATTGLPVSLDQALNRASDTKENHQKRGENLHFSNPAFGSAVRLHKSETF